MPKLQSTNPERGKQLTFAEFAARHRGHFSNVLSLMGLSMPSSSGMVSLARMATPAPLSPLSSDARTEANLVVSAAERDGPGKLPRCLWLLDVDLDASDGYTNSGRRFRKAARNTGATPKCIQLLRQVD